MPQLNVQFAPVTKQLWNSHKILFTTAIVGLLTAISTIAADREVAFFNSFKMNRDVYIVTDASGYKQVLWFKDGQVLSAGDAKPGNHRVVTNVMGEKSPFSPWSVQPYCKMTISSRTLSAVRNSETSEFSNQLLMPGDRLKSVYQTTPKLWSPYRIVFAGIVRNVSVQAVLECKSFTEKFSSELLKEVVGTKGILLE